MSALMEMIDMLMLECMLQDGDEINLHSSNNPMMHLHHASVSRYHVRCDANVDLTSTAANRAPVMTCEEMKHEQHNSRCVKDTCLSECMRFRDRLVRRQKCYHS